MDNPDQSLRFVRVLFIAYILVSLFGLEMRLAIELTEVLTDCPDSLGSVGLLLNLDLCSCGDLLLFL